jgi:hypothetical protein
VENEIKKRKRKSGKWLRKRLEVDEKVQKSIKKVEELMRDNMEPVLLNGLNGFQRKQIHRYFEKTQEYKVKSYT